MNLMRIKLLNQYQESAGLDKVFAGISYLNSLYCWTPGLRDKQGTNWAQVNRHVWRLEDGRRRNRKDRPMNMTWIDAMLRRLGAELNSSPAESTDSYRSSRGRPMKMLVLLVAEVEADSEGHAQDQLDIFRESALPACAGLTIARATAKDVGRFCGIIIDGPGFVGPIVGTLD